jgi:DNA-directed RNA polymerase specialized sigma24 family protein
MPDIQISDVTAFHNIIERLAPLEREALIRFYLRAQTAKEVCQSLGLTDDQFRKLKSDVRSLYLSTRDGSQSRQNVS